MSLKKRIFSFLIILLIIVLIISATIITSLNSSEKDSEIINTLGKQRALAEEMGKLALNITSNTDKAVLLSEYMNEMRKQYASEIVPKATKAGIEFKVNPQNDKELHFPAGFTKAVNDNIKSVSARIIANNSIVINKAMGYKQGDPIKAEAQLEQGKDFYITLPDKSSSTQMTVYTSDRATTKGCVTCHNTILEYEDRLNTPFKLENKPIMGLKEIKVPFKEEFITQYENSLNEFKSVLLRAETGEFGLSRKNIIETRRVFDAFLSNINSVLNGKKIKDISGKIITLSSELKAKSHMLVLEYENTAKKNHNNIWISSVSMVVILVVFIIISMWLMNKYIIAPISQLSRAVSSVSQGNLSVELDLTQNKDEISQLMSAFSKMTERLRTIVMNIESAAVGIEKQSSELNNTAGMLKSGSESQFNKGEEAAVSSQELSRAVGDIAQNAENIASAANETTTTAFDGNKVVTNSINEIEEIAKTVNESAEQISSLNEQSQKIGDIIIVINDIADQTNLLALNAAIEAARAGEQGRGFAVVADEVRKLAEKTSKATQEINTMITDIQNNLTNATSTMETIDLKVKKGVELSSETMQALENIINKVKGLGDVVDQISNSTSHMASITNEISTNTDTIREEANVNLSNATQVADSSQSLTDLADNLNNIIRQFTITKHGSQHNEQLSISR